MTLHKVLFIGEEQSGKTAIIQQALFRQFTNDYNPTWGASLLQHQVDGQTLDLIDLGGSPRNKFMWTVLSRDIDICVYCIDMSQHYKPLTILQDINAILAISPNTAVVLVGCKSDIEPQATTSDDLNALAREQGYDKVVITSAKKGLHIETLFAWIHELCAIHPRRLLLRAINVLHEEAPLRESLSALESELGQLSPSQQLRISAATHELIINLRQAGTPNEKETAIATYQQQCNADLTTGTSIFTKVLLAVAAVTAAATITLATAILCCNYHATTCAGFWLYPSAFISITMASSFTPVALACAGALVMGGVGVGLYSLFKPHPTSPISTAIDQVAGDAARDIPYSPD